MKSFGVKFFTSLVILSLMGGYIPLHAKNLPSEDVLTPIESSAPVEIIVKLSDELEAKDAVLGVETEEVVAEEENVEIIEKVDESMILVAAEGENIKEVIEDLEENPRVDYAEPNYSRNVLAVPNDTFFSLQWGLHNSGQNILGGIGIADKDMDIPEAWEISQGSEIIVAVIDTGVDYTHPDIQNNMWDGSSCSYEYEEEGVVHSIEGGCIHGYDFGEGDKDPMPNPLHDLSYHGTHVAGIIAAEKGNGKGVAGVAPNAKIMALKFGFDVLSEVRAIDFARENGAKIINASFGGGGFSQTEYDAIKRFTDAGGIFVAAAGNNGTDNEGNHVYPSDYDLPNLISVASTNNRDELSDFSSFGADSVDIGAPGESIAGLNSENHNYIYLNGTSMASPAVAGIASLLWTYNSQLTASQIKEIILSTGDIASNLEGKTVTGKRVNAHSALNIFSPRVGFADENELTGEAINDRNDGSGIIDISFRIVDGLEGLDTTLTDFEYSEDFENWISVASTSEYLSSNWQGPYVSAKAYSATPYVFSFDTDLIFASTTSTSTSFWVRFKSHDNATSSPYAYSREISFDRIAPQATILNSLATTTESTSVSFQIGGEGVTHYKYKLDENNWSDESEIGSNLELSGLDRGAHEIKIIGRDASNNWQSTASSTDFAWTILEPVTAAVPPPSGGGGGGGGSGSTQTTVYSSLGDTNTDGRVDILDFNSLIVNWGRSGALSADFNRDNTVDLLDFNLLMVNWKP